MTMRPLLDKLRILELQLCSWEAESLAMTAGDVLVEIVRCAPKLRELMYDRWLDRSVLDEILFMEIVEAVSARKVKRQLIIVLPSTVALVPIDMRKKYKNTVKITFRSDFDTKSGWSNRIRACEGLFRD